MMMTGCVGRLEVSRLQRALHSESRRNEELAREVEHYQQGVWVCDQVVGQAFIS